MLNYFLGKSHFFGDIICFARAQQLSIENCELRIEKALSWSYGAQAGCVARGAPLNAARFPA